MVIKNKTNPKELPVEIIMQKNFIYIAHNQSIYEAANLMSKENVGMLPVIQDKDILVGVITDRDIVTRVIANKKDLHKTTVSECMTANPCRIVPSMSCSEAMDMMSMCKVRRVAVVKNHRLVGILSTSDIARAFDFCPNATCPYESCILVTIAADIQETSHLANNIDKLIKQAMCA